VVLAALLYLSCAIVQGVTIRNFFKEKEKDHIKLTAYFGAGMGCVSFSLILSDIITVIFYPGKKVDEYSAALSLVWSTLVMLPITHYMVIKHQKHKPTPHDIATLKAA
jgi:hypothetical protein